MPFFSVEESQEELTAVISGRLMSLEDGLEQIKYCLGFLRIGRDVLLPVEEVSCAEWLIVENRVAWLESAIFSSLKGTSHLLEEHLKVFRLLNWLCG